MRGPLNLYKPYKFKFIINISLVTKCTYTTKTYQPIKIRRNLLTFLHLSPILTFSMNDKLT
ncbi:hypothetical protein B296_00029333 [Ensete ventricosum]|uniref:Uncharacterized protein n=1 Tax=Ensete ventricosum TaxID=4639 RepID=A0A426Y8P5_ENSVE|nr:hypothetical protein B296_00029333 [Ensete ventricosum]